MRRVEQVASMPLAWADTGPGYVAHEHRHRAVAVLSGGHGMFPLERVAYVE